MYDFIHSQGNFYAVELLCQAELRALGTWEDREIDEHIRLTQKYLVSFREQVKNL